ncbi:AMP-dependent synthetase/ligase [Rhodococcus sp. T7]|uniref:AMP-dependent synthetase/ligase n=1 Tax=Rhodococcus sp. T7 TaxID=627444 RepID=UPI001357B246|nr:long-chain fatty acid--CoA ligase [Rhodococcus sp. T7]KAF0964876.1 Long-chain-fatty-acid--CoA ligase FadD15 [Rhodococcus sp. T7]
MTNTTSGGAATVCAAFQLTSRIDPDAVAFRTPRDLISVTWGEYSRRVRGLAEGLHALGVRRGDVIALMMRNKPEFALIDSAAMHLGAATLSVYNTSSAEQLSYVLNHSGARIMICEEQMLDTVRRSAAPLDYVVSIDGPSADADLTVDQVEAMTAHGFDFEGTWQSVTPDDTLTLIYTSGTTGNPKAVRISHSNVVTAAQGLNEVIPIRFGDRITSFMPAAHIADRVSSLYWMAILGMQVTYVDDAKSILPALVDTRPTVWFAVPRVWEKFRAALEAMITNEPDAERQATAQRAIELGKLRTRAVLAGDELPVSDLAEWELLDKSVLAEFRSAIGLDQARVSLCGSAPISADTLEFFLAIGVRVVEVWGMTETTGIGTINPPDAIRLGTVGTVLPGNEVKLATDGELLIRGPVCFDGYRSSPKLTTEAIDTAGWVRTGDIATIDEDGYVRIVDRKKEILINAAGKNMSPANIENAIKAACPLIASVVAIGDGRPYNVALIALDPDAAAALAGRLGLKDHSAATLARNEQVQALVAAGVEAGNATLSRVEQIKRHRLIDAYWDAGSDELTPTMKLRRKPISKKYADQITALYEQI